MARRGRRGEGTVYYSRRDRRWIARWPLGVVDGRRLDKRVKCRTEDEANTELDKLRRIYGAGGKPASGTLDAYLAEWLPAHARSIRASTRRSYEGHIRLHISPVLGGIPLGKLAPRDVRRLVADLERKGRSAGTIHLVVRTLSAALNQAVADRIIVDNATEGVRLPRIEREPVLALSEPEAERILAAVRGTFLDALVVLLLGSGIRLGEACGLDWGDVDLEHAAILVRRSKTSVRAVPISDDAVDALRAHRAAAKRYGVHEPVFLGPRTGERLRTHTVSHAFPKLLAAAGLERLTPHGLRHGAATLMVARGVHMRIVAEQLGHRNPALTARVYAHVLPESQREAVKSLNRRSRAT